jgi:hypothetical protein
MITPVSTASNTSWSRHIRTRHVHSIHGQSHVKTRAWLAQSFRTVESRRNRVSPLKLQISFGTSRKFSCQGMPAPIIRLVRASVGSIFQCNQLPGTFPNPVLLFTETNHVEMKFTAGKSPRINEERAEHP